MDTIRILRIIEYTGPRDAVEKQIKNSLHGEREGASSLSTGERCRIRVTTLGDFAEIINQTNAWTPDRPTLKET